MKILGISCFYHDAAAALIDGGRLVAACEEERFSRKKHDPSYPARAVEFCLRRGGLQARDLDYVVFYEKPFRKFERLLTTFLRTAPRSWRVFPGAMTSWLGEKLWIKQLLRERLEVPTGRLLFVDHHLSHAASAFLCSPFEDAAVMTVDGVGEWATASLGRARQAGPSGRAEIELFSELRFPNSLGLFYSAFTAYLGFEVNEGEYKVMGMAPYGEPRYEDEVRRLLRLSDDGSFELDMSYFSFDAHPSRTYGPKFEALFGPARDPRARFVTEKTSLYDDPRPPSAEELKRNRRYADVAASVQKATEDALLRMARHLQRRTGAKRLCLAGGVAFNSAANGRLQRETPFEEIYVQPAAGDAGGALGAALYAHRVLLGRPERFVLEHAAWGEAFDDRSCRSALDARGARYSLWEDPGRLARRAAELIAGGKALGWFQGPDEWGPRALGHRSILADPRLARMKDDLNIKIKFREPFRPFAPSALAEKAAGWFDLPRGQPGWPERFMLAVAPVRADKRELIPAVTHVDGSARLQAVHADTEPLYHRLISEFEGLSGTPLVLNTSFNLRGEPIVHGPEDAWRTFQASGLDALVLGPCLVEKPS